MSVGIPPFLTLTEKPSALRDKSGALQNPDRLASFQTSSLEFPLDQATIRFVLLGFTILAKSMMAIVSSPGNGP